MFTPLMPGNRDHACSRTWCSRANGSCVDTTICDGKILMREGVLLTCDEQHVLAEANAAFLRVLERMEVPEEYAHLVVR